MAEDIKIDPDGTLHVNGKEVTPQSLVTGVGDLTKLIDAARMKKNWSIKNAEKVIVYIAGLVAATNGFDAFKIPTNIREWIIGGSALVIAAIHNSTNVT